MIFDKLTSILNKLTPEFIKNVCGVHIDKYYHFIVGVFIGLVCIWSHWVSILMSIWVAVMKEIYDVDSGGKFDILDIVATIIGTILSCGIITLIQSYV